MADRGTRAEIDLIELEKLCMLHCSDKELADWFGVTTRTIERRRREPEFAAVMERGKSKGKISLRRSQMKLVEAGNPALNIWMGKQLLGQRDQVGVAISGPDPAQIDAAVRQIIIDPVALEAAERFLDLIDSGKANIASADDSVHPARPMRAIEGEVIE